MSVGAAWWAARASGLISSLLAITPTWRHMDPLPVLGRDDDEAAGGWDDPVGEEAAKEEASANEMFDGKAKKRARLAPPDPPRQLRHAAPLPTFRQRSVGAAPDPAHREAITSGL